MLLYTNQTKDVKIVRFLCMTLKHHIANFSKNKAQWTCIGALETLFSTEHRLPKQ